MKERGIISLTDFIVNAGGGIACAVELKMDHDAAYCDRVREEDGVLRAPSMHGPNAAALRSTTHVRPIRR